MLFLPFKQLQISKEGEITHNVTKAQLEKYSVFNYAQEGLYEYYYAPSPPYGQLGFPIPKGYRYPGDSPYGHPYDSFPRHKYRGEANPWAWEYFPERIRLSALLDRAVLNEEGYEVGTLEDLIITQKGKVKEVILSVGRFLEKRVAIPFQPLKITELGVVCDVTQAQLKALPEYRD